MIKTMKEGEGKVFSRRKSVQRPWGREKKGFLALLERKQGRGVILEMRDTRGQALEAVKVAR